jgi:RimJ/RimL family protein N-acetyltransferase
MSGYSWFNRRAKRISTTAQRTQRSVVDEHRRERLRLTRVHTLDEIMYLRQLRNECREYMTQDTQEITETGQILWWQGVDGDPYWQVWLVYEPSLPDPIGFAMLRKFEGFWFATLGLRAWLRGHGYGTEVYRALREMCDEDVYAVIRADNLPSQRAAIKAGYETVEWAIQGQVAMVGRQRRQRK